MVPSKLNLFWFFSAEPFFRASWMDVCSWKVISTRSSLIKWKTFSVIVSTSYYCILNGSQTHQGGSLKKGLSPADDVTNKIFFNGPFPASFFFIFDFSTVNSSFVHCKILWWLSSNWGPLVLEATGLPTESQASTYTNISKA